MLAALTTLLLFQLIGEVFARALNLSVPGPVIGMLLLFFTLWWRGGPGQELRETGQTLLQHLSLLFVPAGTGIMVHLHRVADEWQALALSLLVSTTAALAVTALVMKFAMPRAAAPEKQP